MKQLLLLLSVLVISIESFAQLTATTSTTPPHCSPNNNGSATVTASGGSNYTYKWSTGATTATISNLTAGTYTVTVYSGSGGAAIDSVYTQTFEGAHNWSLNDATGTNDAYANLWAVNDDEGGVPPPGCGVATNGNKTLHVTNSLVGGGAAYLSGGLCGSGICVITNKASTSPNISTVGQSNLKLHFDFIGNGQALSDNASLLYSINGGATFTVLDASLKSIVCGSGQGQWTHRGYSLPVSCNNISNLKIRFNWTNNDDGLGTDPSFAVNNVFIIDSGVTGGGLDSVVTTAVVAANQSIQVSLSSKSNECNGAANGSIMVVLSGNQAPALHNQWYKNGNPIGSDVLTLSNLSAGNYRCIQTNGQGCVDTLDVSLENYYFTVHAADSSICWNEYGTFFFETNLDSVTDALMWYSATDSPQYINSTGNNVENCFQATGFGCTIDDCAEVYVQGPLSTVTVTANNGWVTSSEVGAHYQWLINGNPVANSDTISIQVTQDGTYTVNVFDAGGCGESGSVVISNVSETVSNRFQLSPNPADHALRIQFQNDGINTVTICDLHGKLMLQTVTSVSDIQVDVFAFPAGVYLLRSGDMLQRFEVIHP